MHLLGHICAWLVLWSVAVTGLSAQGAAAKGPLRVLTSNPRYFTDGSGRAIYLVGSHNWNNFQDTGHRRPAQTDPPAPFDYRGYLDFLEARHHNFFRLWRWESPKWTDDEPAGVGYSVPHPWLRPGPGLAADGKPKFDLARFDQQYFDRMRERVRAAGDRGIYVSVMLFEGFELQFYDAWKCHPFRGANNINEVEGDADGDGRGVEFNMLVPSPMGKRVLELQQAYIRKVIDTVNDLDNVLYEVCNEAGVYSKDWQYRVIRYVKEYEAGKGRQHPVGMTFMYKGGTNDDLYNSPADWISPNPGDSRASYEDNPPSAYKGKVIVSDTDHLCGHTCGDAVWVWKSFCRGLNVLFMEELTPSPTWHDSAREAMGQVRRYAEKMNLAEMVPRDDLASVRYCLAKPGSEYLVFQPGHRGEFTIDLRGGPGPYAVEWFSVNRGTAVRREPVRGGAVTIFQTPFGGPAVLYLKRE
jgi:hypothetical protein